MTRDKRMQLVVLMTNGASQAHCRRDKLRTTRAVQMRLVQDMMKLTESLVRV